MTRDVPDNPGAFDLVQDVPKDTVEYVDRFNEDVSDAWTRGSEATSAEFAAGSDRIEQAAADIGTQFQAGYDGIERVATALSALDTATLRIVLGTTALPADPDLLQSAILSPLTAAGVTTAALTAVGRTSAALTASTSITIVATTIVTTYRLAEDSLAAAATTLDANWRFAQRIGSTALELTADGSAGLVNIALSSQIDLVEYAYAAHYTAASGVILVGGIHFGLAVGLNSIATGFGTELLEAVEEGWNAGEPFTGFQRFDSADAWANTTALFEATLGATGPFFDDILDTLIQGGRTFGLFRDDAYSLVDTPPISSGELDRRRGEASDASAMALGYNLELDETGAVVPRSVADLAASASQIDATGKDEFSTIRVVSSEDEFGNTTYLVILPSTQNWSPVTGGPVNDLTADLYGLTYGTNALNDAAVAALAKAYQADSGGPGDVLPPSTIYAGFSLGGISAATIAATPGTNASRIVTFGSPYATIDIPGHVNVIAYEATTDLVPRLDGAPNPAQWTTTRVDSPPIPGATVEDLTVHDANRYALMAAQNPESTPELDKFFEGTIEVHDYYAVRA